MPEGNPEFWSIVEPNFPQASIDHRVELAQLHELEQRRERFLQERAERIYAASQDSRIADCLLFGSGETEELLARIQSDYDLTEIEARDAIDIGFGDIGGIVDYGDEA